MIVGQREQVEAGIDERLQPQRVALEIIGLGLPLGVGDKIVAVGNDRLEIEEGKIAIHLGRDAAQRIGEAHDLAVLAEALRLRPWRRSH